MIICDAAERERVRVIVVFSVGSLCSCCSIIMAAMAESGRPRLWASMRCLTAWALRPMTTHHDGERAALVFPFPSFPLPFPEEGEEGRRRRPTWSPYLSAAQRTRGISDVGVAKMLARGSLDARTRSSALSIDAVSDDAALHASSSSSLSEIVSDDSDSDSDSEGGSDLRCPKRTDWVGSVETMDSEDAMEGDGELRWWWWWWWWCVGFWFRLGLGLGSGLRLSRGTRGASTQLGLRRCQYPCVGITPMSSSACAWVMRGLDGPAAAAAAAGASVAGQTTEPLCRVCPAMGEPQV